MQTATQIATVSIGNHGGLISPQAVINRLRVRNIRTRRPYEGLVLTRRHCQAIGYMNTAHNDQARAMCLPDRAQMR